MDLKKLKHAVTLADEGSFAKAAERLHLTQPALTRSIQALESELGVKLFDRHPAGARLTVAGHSLVMRARDLIREASGFKREADLIRRAETGQLKIGMAPVPAQLLLPYATAEIMKNNPAIKIDVEVQGYNQLLERLLTESLEFFVSNITRIEARTDIIIEPLGTSPLGFFIRREHPLVGSRIRSVNQLLQYPLLTHSFQRNDNAPVAYENGLDFTQWPGRFTCDDFHALRIVALETDGLLMTARNLIQEEIESGDLVPLTAKIVGKEKSARLGIVRLPNRSLSPLGKLFIQSMEKLVVSRLY